MTPAFAAFVAERNLALVLVDRVGTPDLFPTWLHHVGTGNAPTFALVRWIGDDKKGPSGDRELQIHRDDDLVRWAGRCADLAATRDNRLRLYAQSLRGACAGQCAAAPGTLGALGSVARLAATWHDPGGTAFFAVSRCMPGMERQDFKGK